MAKRGAGSNAGVIVLIFGAGFTLAETEHPLKGTSQLLPADDLIYSRNYVYYPDANQLTRYAYSEASVFLTDDDAVTSAESDVVTGKHQCNSSAEHVGSEAFAARLYDWDSGKDQYVVVGADKLDADPCHIRLSVQVFDQSSDGELLYRKVLKAEGVDGNASVAADFNGNASVAADFNGNGVDEIFVVNYLYDPSVGNDAYNYSYWSIIRASDPSVTGSKLLESQQFKRQGNSSNYRPRFDNPVVGDLNNDGNKNIVYVTEQGMRVITVCNGYSAAGNLCEQKPAWHIIDHGLVPWDVTHDEVVSAGSGVSASVTVGNYRGFGDELLFAYSINQPGSWGSVRLLYYNFDEQMNPQLIQNVDLAGFHVNFTSPSYQFLDSGRLDWGSYKDRAVMAVGYKEFDNNRLLDISFDGPTDEPIKVRSWFLPHIEGHRLSGLAVGHFKDLSDASNGAHKSGAFNARVAVTTTDGGADHSLRIFDPLGSTDTDLVFNWGRIYDFPAALGGEYSLLNNPGNRGKHVNLLRSADIQNRSLRLGEPDVVRIEQHMQPWLILGAPPSHIAYIETLRYNEPLLTNFSALPESFYSKFKRSDSEDVSSTFTEKTTLSHSVYGTTSAEYSNKKSLFSALAGTFSVKAEAGGGYASDEMEDKGWNMQESFSSTITGGTGAADLIGYTSTVMNYYLYPVIGETACPVTVPDCSDEERMPMVIQITVPAVSDSRLINGNLLRWYQPVHEPHNIFSYPWDYDQLAERNPALMLHSNNFPASFSTDSSAQEYTLNWSQGAGKENTVGVMHKASWHASTSISYGFPDLSKVVSGTGVNVSTTVDYNGSTGWGDVSTGASNFSASMGIEINKPRSFKDPGHYAYNLRPYLLGEVLDSWSGEDEKSAYDLIQGADIVSSGPLQVAYTVDPGGVGVGSWWESGANAYKRNINIAFNNPNRYRFAVGKAGDGNGNDVPEECLLNSLGDYKVTCAIPRIPKKAGEDIYDGWVNKFYDLRGFFIRPTDQGPNRTMATDGDEMLLQVRVYNYSFVDMPEGSRVVVRFYEQEMDNSSKAPIGSSRLIAEESMSPLPGFQSKKYQHAGENKNWRLVSTKWHTSGQAGKYFGFWVVAWAEDAQGNKIEEVPHQGLTEKPGHLNWIDEVPFEWVTILGSEAPPAPNGDVEIVELETSFSNNAAFYKELFYVASPAAPLQSTAQSMMVGGMMAVSDKVVIDRLDFSADNLTLGEEVDVTASIYSPGRDRNGVMVLASEGGSDGPVVFTEFVPYLKAYDANAVRFRFEPRRCGENLLTVSIALGDGRQLTETGSVTVSCQQ
ncbi:MAG: hypothetical protein GY814_01560 [Gammaproteobacteria bacterium]|nr:hypothetical protein [Gammaproteobacteria bacterium]